MATYFRKATLRLQLRRLVARRNAAVIKVRRLAKASNVAKRHDLERLMSEQLVAIQNLNALIDELQGTSGPPPSW